MNSQSGLHKQSWTKPLISNLAMGDAESINLGIVVIHNKSYSATEVYTGTGVSRTTTQGPLS
jgi:hypothetical protein